MRTTWGAALVAAALLPGAGCAATVRADDARVAYEGRFEPDEPRWRETDAIASEYPCLEANDCLHTLTHRGRRFDYHASHPLFQPNDRVQHVVILVHGLGGSAAANFDTLADAARRYASDRSELSELLLVAPHFADEGAKEVATDRHRWTKTGWASGDKSVTKPRLSSFSILDGVVRELLHGGRFPNLHSIVLAGHSAGGQMVQRYAAISRIEEELPKDRAIAMRYVVANPSSYLYLGPTRPFFAPGPTGFGLPYAFDRSWKTTPPFAGAPICPEAYDEYRYGLEDLNAYAKAVGPKTIRRQYPRREVTYLIGRLDAIAPDCEGTAPPPELREKQGFEACDRSLQDPEATACWCREMAKKSLADLDRSCPATLQGEDRHARALAYFRYLNAYFRGHRHRLEEIPFAGHSVRAMFAGPGGGELFRRP